MLSKKCDGPFCQGIEWPIDRFEKSKSVLSGYRTECKTCVFNKRREEFIPYICEYCNQKHEGLYGTGRFCDKICSQKKSKSKNINNDIKYKKCSRISCIYKGKLQSISNFYIRSETNNYRSECKDCSKKGVIKNISTLEGYIKNSVNSAKKRAIKYNRKFNITYIDILKMWNEQKGRCKISGIKMTHIIGNKKNTLNNPTNMSIDRIDSFKGYTINNIQLVTNFIQTCKMDLDISVFRDLLYKTVDYDRNGIYPDDTGDNFEKLELELK